MLVADIFMGVWILTLMVLMSILVILYLEYKLTIVKFFVLTISLFVIAKAGSQALMFVVKEYPYALF